ncbi:hypothetical protein Gotur_026113 [Gossypium turneri]
MPTFALFLILVPGASLARHLFNQDCGSVFCGNLNISYPLRLKNQPPQCGCHDLELEYRNTVLNLNQACTVEAEVPIMVKSISGMSTLAIYNKLSDGFYLSWHQISL